MIGSRCLLLLSLVAGLAAASRGSTDAHMDQVQALADLQAQELVAAARTLPPTEDSIEAELRERILDLVADLAPGHPGRREFGDLELRPMTESEASADAQRRNSQIGGMPGPSQADGVLQPHELRSMAVEMAREQLAVAETLLPNPEYRNEYAARRRALALAEAFAEVPVEGDDERVALGIAIERLAKARYEPWTGRWNTPWGEIELLARGASVVGRSETGQLTGSQRDGTARGSFQFGQAKGKFTMEMDPRGGRIRLRTQGDDVDGLRFCHRIGDLQREEEP